MQSAPIKAVFRSPTGNVSIKGAKANNLQNVSVDIPTGVLTVITGVAGSGKSSFVGVSSRSNPGTYTGIMDDVRKAFATAAT